MKTIETLDESISRTQFHKACREYGIENVTVEVDRTKGSPIYKITIKETQPMKTTKTIDLGNNEQLTRGIFPNPDGTFTALTFTKSKDFKTRKGAEKWFKRWTGLS